MSLIEINPNKDSTLLLALCILNTDGIIPHKEIPIDTIAIMNTTQEESK